jgi:hypothetical protein
VKSASLLAAAGFAAVATHFFDRDLGRRRRARVRDKIYGKLSHADEAAQASPSICETGCWVPWRGYASACSRGMCPRAA